MLGFLIVTFLIKCIYIIYPRLQIVVRCGLFWCVECYEIRYHVAQLTSTIILSSQSLKDTSLGEGLQNSRIFLGKKLLLANQ